MMNEEQTAAEASVGGKHIDSTSATSVRSGISFQRTRDVNGNGRTALMKTGGRREHNQT